MRRTLGEQKQGRAVRHDGCVACALAVVGTGRTTSIVRQRARIAVKAAICSIAWLRPSPASAPTKAGPDCIRRRLRPPRPPLPALAPPPPGGCRGASTPPAPPPRAFPGRRRAGGWTPEGPPPCLPIRTPYGTCPSGSAAAE
eukprot:1190005-Prorocentrum_minimum.AAC.2